MSVYVICISNDLKNDADLYALEKHGAVIKPEELAGKLKDGDTLVMYGHGQYRNLHGKYTATNKVIWGNQALTGSEVCDKLIELDLPTGLANLTIIMHCCFTGGTIENPPTEIESQQTFAGQLCSALKAYYFPGLRVIGYQGASKFGKAGFKADQSTNAPRLSRSQVDPNKGELWQLVFGGDGDRDTLLSKGGSATWG